MTIRKFNLILSIIFLLIGGAIYIIYRDNSYIANFAETILNLNNVRKELINFNSVFLKFLFPDFLWALSLSCGLISLYPPKFKTILTLCIITLLLGTVWELLQLVNIVSGTFDVLDILMYLSAAIAAVTINIFLLRRDA